MIGAGYEHVDLGAARARGVMVTNGAGVNAPSVADHAMALLLSLVRDIPARRVGTPWRVAQGHASFTGGQALGILGLGSVAWPLPSVRRWGSICR